MTSSRDPSILLRPPPGPITWLFPELLGAGPTAPARKDDDDAESRADAAREWDLASMRPDGGDLMEAILASEPAEVRVPPGPLGSTLRAWIEPRLREHGVPVRFEPAKAGAPPLEVWLEERGRRAQSGEVIASGEGRPGLVPLHPGAGLEHDIDALIDRVNADRAGWRRDGLVPYYLSAPATDPEGGPVQTRMPLSWWGLLPGDRYPSGVRRAARELIRRLYPERYLQFLAHENHALAGVDVYGEALFRRSAVKREPDATRPGSPRPLVIGVDGIDGAGKSSHVASIRGFLQARGLLTAVHKMYRHGVFHDTVTDLTRQCAGTKNLHLWRLQRLVKAFDSVKYYHAAVAPDLVSHDALVFDRYTLTHHAAGAGRFHHDPFTRELLSVYPRADRVYLIDVPVREALGRIGQRLDRTVDENPFMLARYRHTLRSLAGREGLVEVDGRAPAEENRRFILEDLERVVDRWSREIGR